jgi:uncharacterized membrane protein
MADMTSEEVDAQVAAILGKIDALIARMDAFEHEMRDTTRDIISALLNNMNAMYESGSASGAWRSKMEHEAAETRQTLQKINQRLDDIEAHQRNDAAREQLKPARSSGRS